MKNTTNKLLLVYALLATSYAIYISLVNRYREQNVPITKIEVSFFDLRADADENWVGVKSISSYYQEDDKKILHGDSVEIKWTYPNALLFTKRYSHGNLIGTNVSLEDLSSESFENY